MANQAHGFTWESAIKSGAFGIVDQHIGYTSVFDIPAVHNTFNREENISVKVCGADKADCGDVRRISEYKNQKVTMIIVRYAQDTPATKKIQQIYEINMGGHEAHAILFGSVTDDEINGLRQLMAALPAGPLSPGARAAIHAEKARLNAKSGVIRFNPKMDSGTQRRLQCSIPKLSAFLEAHPELVISSTTDSVVRGAIIPSTIESGLRQRRQRED